MRFINILTVTTVALALIGCGGGGGGGSSSSGPTVFSLFDPVLATVGGTRTFNLTGSSNAGDTLTAVWSIARRADTTLGGQPVQQFDQLITITFVNTGQVVPASVTTYTNAAGTLVQSVNNNTGDVGLPDGPQTPLPATAVIGAFGTAGDTSYSDGSSAMNSWRLDAHPGSSSQADLTNFITFVSITALNFDAQAIRVIDSSGNTLGLRLAYFYEDGTTVDLST